MQPDGVGALHIAYEQLKARLEQEGLFAQSRKKALPAFPKRIGVITSPTGAAVRDIINILSRRYQNCDVCLYPVLVQGPEAPPEIAEAIAYANDKSIGDLIITGRGGGSIEDLWAFNDERVARAIFATAIPVISAVGHEPDVTIADFVADVRAATPSHAAEIAVPDINETRDTLNALEIRVRQHIGGAIKARRQRLNDLSARRVLQNPRNYIDDKRVYLDHALDRLCSATQRGLHGGRERYARLAAALDAMSPLKVLGRGYAIARRTDGTIIKTASDVCAGDRVTVRLKTDEIRCVVD